MTELKEYQTLMLERDGQGCAHLTLNRPNVRNAFNAQMIEELGMVFAALEQDADLRLVCIRGEGKVFCAGGDLNWMKDSAELSYDQNLQDTRTLARLFDRINQFAVPVIALVHGAALGGGVGIVSVCDYVVATEDCLFSLSEARLGLIPACIGPYVLSKVGASFGRELFLSAQRFKGAKAHQVGLVHQLVSGSEDLQGAFEEVRDNILLCGPQAVRAAKSLVMDLIWPEKRSACENYIELIASELARLRTSPEGQEGVRAFLEKRKASWVPSSDDGGSK